MERIPSTSLAFIRTGPDEWLIGTEIRVIQEPPRELDFFISDFFNSSRRQVLRPERTHRLTTAELAEVVERSGPDPSFRPQWHAPYFPKFFETFQNIQTVISEGRIKKLVPILYEIGLPSPTGSQALQILKNLISAPPSLTPYGYWTGNEGQIGATPELILRETESRRFQTAAVAGTRRLSEAPTLLERPKDREEHRLVVEDIEARLSLFGDVILRNTQELQFGDLVHLVTPIELFIPPSATFCPTFFQLLAHIHPTPALAAFPRTRGLEWLKAQPDVEIRGRFGAPFGFVTEQGHPQAFAAIRCLEWNANSSRIASGAGIVADSDAEKEWQELRNKREAVKGLLGLT